MATALTGVENAEVARIFRQLADLLEIQEANPFRVRAYRNAARAVEELPEPVEELAHEGPAALVELPGIGDDLAAKIVEIVETGSLGALQDAEQALPKGLVDVMRERGRCTSRWASLR